MMPSRAQLTVAVHRILCNPDSGLKHRTFEAYARAFAADFDGFSEIYPVAELVRDAFDYADNGQHDTALKNVREAVRLLEQNGFRSERTLPEGMEE